jgi:hypothetical protein
MLDKFPKDRMRSEVLLLIDRAGFEYNDFSLTNMNEVVLVHIVNGVVIKKTYLEEFAREINTALSDTENKLRQRGNRYAHRNNFFQEGSGLALTDLGKMNNEDEIEFRIAERKISALKDLASVVEYWLLHPDAYPSEYAVVEDQTPTPDEMPIDPSSKPEEPPPKKIFTGKTKREFIDMLAAEYDALPSSVKKYTSWKSFVEDNYQKYEFPQWKSWTVNLCYEYARQFAPEKKGGKKRS